MVAWILVSFGVSIPALEFLAVAASFILLPFELIFYLLISILGADAVSHPVASYFFLIFPIVAYAAIGALIGYLVGRSREKKAKLLPRA